MIKPVEINKYYLDKVCDGLKQELWQTMFSKIFAVLQDNHVANDKSTLANALKSGTIYYENGAFKAKNNRFSNAVAKELEKLGAKFKYGAYYIERSLLPMELDSMIALIAAKEAAKITVLNTLLAELALTVDKDTMVKAFIQPAVEGMFKKLQYDLDEQLKQFNIPTTDVSEDIPEYQVPAEYEQFYNDFYENYYKTDKELKDELKALKIKLKHANTDGEKELLQLQIDQLEDKLDKPQKSKPTRKGNKPPKDDEGDTDIKDTNKPPKTDDKQDDIPETPEAPDINLDGLKITERAKKISRDYVHNMDYWVKKWKTNEIIKMRRDIVKMVSDGKRWDSIAEYFETRWKIGKDKAAFLARNESGIAWSVIMATKYQEEGFIYFYWDLSTARDKRKLHEQYSQKTDNKYGLFGKNIFAFDNPPIIEELAIPLGKDSNGKMQYEYIPKPDGQRGLPKQTYNCLCGMTPYVDKDFITRNARIQNAKRNILTKAWNALTNSEQRNHKVYRYRRFGQGQTF